MNKIQYMGGLKYKVGDRVKIQSLERYNKYKNRYGDINYGCETEILFTSEMSSFCGQVATITRVRYIGGVRFYHLAEDKGAHLWVAGMFECLVERDGKKYPYKIGDRVVLKGNNRCATITDLKYNSWGNLSYYIKIDNDKDISIDYPTELLLPYDNMIEEIVEEKTKPEPKFKVGDRIYSKYHKPSNDLEIIEVIQGDGHYGYRIKNHQTNNTYFVWECEISNYKLVEDETKPIKDAIAWPENQGKETSWKPSKEEMDVLYGLAYITNKYDEHKEEVITRLYQNLKREFFNGSSYENMFPNTENDVRRRSTIQVLEYARSLDNYNQYGKIDIDKNIAWLEKQGKSALEARTDNEFVEEETPLYKAIVDKNGNMTGEFIRLKEVKQEINLPEGYIVKDENGNVINAQKIVLEKLVVPKFKKGDKIKDKNNRVWYVAQVGNKHFDISRVPDGPGYFIPMKDQDYYELVPDIELPKTFEECVSVLMSEGGNRMSLEQMNTFRKLIDARNAYWTIYGKENGLEKPWEPDYKNECQKKYCIYNNKGDITKSVLYSANAILSFPTEEMRDTFYENFKSEIESCKEFL